MRIRTGIGQDSHRFLANDSAKPCVIGGLIFENTPGLDDHSDGDVVYHAICNAITSVTHVPILRGLARELYQKDGIADSEIYLRHALKTLQRQKIEHVALSIEGKRPLMVGRIEEMRKKIASVLFLETSQVGLTIISGDGLTNFGLGDGLSCLCLLTTLEIS